MVVPDEGPEKGSLGEDLGSEEDLLYEDFRGSAHRFGHPGGGGGEQLAINEVRPLPRTHASPPASCYARLQLSVSREHTSEPAAPRPRRRRGVTVRYRYRAWQSGAA